ncbi:MAG: PDZ domain-containing protein [Candidatus Cloacimonetes bacterium]|nr:PDZ domain-containing protein [Candidatus Cloacimonadota bacterium]
MKYCLLTLIVFVCSNLISMDAYLGIYVTTPNQNELQRAGLTFGLLIDIVMPGSPADVYDLRENDIIYSINNVVIRNESDLQRFLTSINPNETISVSLSRNQQPIIRQVQLRRREALYRELYIFNYIQNPWLFIGIDVEPISSALARLLSLEKGMVILDVRGSSIASLQGIEAGDIIISINGIETVNELIMTEAMNMGLQNQPMEFYIWRNNQRMTKLVDLSNSLNENINSNEVFILGPDVFNNELYSYSREMINRILNKSRSEIESDIERLEQEIFQLRQRMENGN